MSDKSDHDMLVEIHTVVVKGKMEERLNSVEKFTAGAKVVLGLISAGIAALVTLAFTGHLPSGK